MRNTTLNRISSWCTAIQYFYRGVSRISTIPILHRPQVRPCARDAGAGGPARRSGSPEASGGVRRSEPRGQPVAAVGEPRRPCAAIHQTDGRAGRAACFGPVSRSWPSPRTPSSARRKRPAQAGPALHPADDPRVGRVAGSRLPAPGDPRPRAKSITRDSERPGRTARPGHL